MDDLTTLDDLGRRLDPVPDVPLDRARAAVLAGLSGDAPARSRARLRFASPMLRPALAGVLVAAVALGGTLGPDLLREDGPRRGAAAGATAEVRKVLERAAQAAERKAHTAPRPDQWIYKKYRAEPGLREDQQTSVLHAWYRADGRDQLMVNDDGSHFAALPQKFGETVPPGSYVALAALPTEPEALLAKATTLWPGRPTWDRDTRAFHGLKGLVQYHMLPPKVEAAVFRAMKLIPGITVSRYKPIDRERVATLQRRQGTEFEILFLDARTYRYAGERTYPADGGRELAARTRGMAPSAMMKQMWEMPVQRMTLLESGIVEGPAVGVIDVGVIDKPGRRP